MDYKLIALDLDGTTVKKANKISKENIATIKWALENDIKVIIATGRSIGAIRTVAKKLHLISHQMPVIGFNGGVIYDFAKEKILKQNVFTTTEVVAIFNLANQYGVRLWAYSVTNDKIAYVNTNKGLMVKWMSHHTKRRRIVLIDYTNFKDEAYKFVVSGRRQKVLDFKNQVLKEFSFNIFDWSYLSKKNLNLEISPENSDKKDALEYLTKIFNIQPKEVIAMGDGSNDFEMLKWAGLGIAMENAKDSIKVISNEITGHHKKSGVAKAIKKHVKK